MSDKASQAERISSFMDGETEGSLDWLCQDESATACWRRFHIIRGAMRDYHDTHLCEDFTSRVMQALEQEPTVFNPQLSSRRKSFKHNSFLKPIAGLAVAATVAAVTVLSFQSIYSTEQSPLLISNNVAEQAANQAAINQNMLVSPELVEVAENRAANSEEDLDGYLLEHMEQSGNAPMQGMLPYVRLAGYDE